MNTTIVIAIVTAVATLSGGFIGSVTSLRIHKHQVKELDRLVRQHRDDLKTSRKREIRRDAYVLLLNRVDELDAMIRKCWELNPLPGADDPIPDAIIDANDRVASIVTALNTVHLEGPQAVADAGADIKAAFHSELSTVLRLVRKNAGQREMLLILASGDFQKATHERMLAKAALINAAQAALNELP